MSIMEEGFLRFPHLGIQIFEKLDDSNLAKCRKVNRSWSYFIDFEELPWKRIQQNWDKSLREYPCEKAQTKLNWDPKTDLETGLEKTIKYFKEMM